MKNQNEFKKDLLVHLKEILKWSNKFKIGKEDFSFDIDNKLFILSENYDANFKRGSLLLIYNLVDYYCDAVKHRFSEIDNNYLVIDAENDLKEIIKSIEDENGATIKLPLNIEKKLSRIFKKKTWIDKLFNSWQNIIYK